MLWRALRRFVAFSHSPPPGSDESVDEAAQVRPNAAPRLQRLAAHCRDRVIAPRRPRHRNFDAAGQQARSMQRTQHRIDRALLQERLRRPLWRRSPWRSGSRTFPPPVRSSSAKSTMAAMPLCSSLRNFFTCASADVTAGSCWVAWATAILGDSVFRLSWRGI